MIEFSGVSPRITTKTRKGRFSRMNIIPHNFRLKTHPLTPPRQSVHMNS